MSQRHEIQQGECLSGIASQYGFLDWRKIYNHPENADFRRLRPNPEVIYPGDQIAIPDRDARVHDGQTAKRHPFKMKKPVAVLRLRIILQGDPLANEDYELSYDGKEVRGTTDGDGALEQKVPVEIQTVDIAIGDYLQHLAVGFLNPIRDTPDQGVSGAQDRLRNLGYGPGPVDGILGEGTEAALRAFQGDYGLSVTGALDDSTRLELERQHGC